MSLYYVENLQDVMHAIR